MSLHTVSHREGQARNVIESAVIGVVLTALSYGVAIMFRWISPHSVKWLEAFAVFTSYSCTYLCVTERRINYPIGAISSAAYAYLFLQSGLLSSAVLNAYLVPTLIYGWIRWRRDEFTRPVTKVELRWLPVYCLVTVAGYAGAAMISQRLHGTMAWSDAIILAGSLMAQFLLDNKKIENWFVWAIVNVFAIYTYSRSGLYLAAVQYVLFLANTAYGFIVWKRSMNNAQVIRPDDGNAADNGALATDSVR